MKVLGVYIQDNLSFGEHVDHLVAQGAQTLYALRILKHHGLNGPNLWTVANSTLLTRLTYAVCIPCMVGTDWLGRVVATEISGIQGRQTGFSSSKPARVRKNL